MSSDLIRIPSELKNDLEKRKKTSDESYRSVIERMLVHFDKQGAALTLKFNAAPLLDILPGLVGGKSVYHQTELLLIWQAFLKVKDVEAKDELEQELFDFLTRFYVRVMNQYKYEIGAISLEDLNRVQDGRGAGPFETESGAATRQEGDQ